MAEVVTESLADYMRTENAKERESQGLEGDGAPLPEAEPMTAAESASSEPVAAEALPVETTERNDDGTFKGQSAKGDSVQKRIDKAVKAQREAERLRDAAEAKARDLEARFSKPLEKTAAPAKVAPAGDDEPTLDKFIADHPDHPDPLSGFTKAVGIWAAKQALAERDQSSKEAQALSEFQQKLVTSDEQGAETFPDWHEVMSSEFASTFVFPPYLVAGIYDSDQSAAIRHYLGTHPDESRALAAQTPTSALVALGQLAARFAPAENGSGVRSVVHSKAKPLTKPLRGSTPSAPSTTKLDPETASLSDWIRVNNAADRQRARDLRGA